MLALFVLLSPAPLARGQEAVPEPQQEVPSALHANKLTFEERADIHMARKEYSDAVDDYLSALKTQKDGQAALWNKLGIAYQQQEKFDRARDAYNRSLRLDKNFAEAWNNLGTTYFLQDRAKKSVKYYQHAIRLKTEVASFHMNLGTGYYRTKKYEPAVNEYRIALTLDPNILREHSAQGTVVDAHAGGEKLYFYLAKAFASLGRTDEAIRYLRRAFEEGFHDKDLLGKDPDFQKISADPAYVELINNPPVAIKE
ncbi:MAG TPA: tetratricopeptide repeat protein [Terriglobia bacterium]|nr:tetratricopeptide repeat protein [Terriglobia bacterium]